MGILRLELGFWILNPRNKVIFKSRDKVDSSDCISTIEEGAPVGL